MNTPSKTYTSAANRSYKQRVMELSGKLESFINTIKDDGSGGANSKRNIIQEKKINALDDQILKWHESNFWADFR